MCPNISQGIENHMSRIITLIPDSGIQFWSIKIPVTQLKNVHCWFWEERNGEYDDGTPRYILHSLREDPETGVLRDVQSGQVPPENQIYEVSWKGMMQMFLHQWIPLPFFALISGEETGNEHFRNGPANWVRGYLTQIREDLYQFDLVFDTSLQTQDNNEIYNAPTIEDSQRQDCYKFVSNFTDVAWFLNEGWVGDWLLKIKQENVVNSSLYEERYCWHYAVYQAFLQILTSLQTLPSVHLLDGGKGITSQVPVEVDLILDLGNSRSCGILVEDHPGQDVNFSNSYPLILRDLSSPNLKYDKPFPSCIEFARANFGSDLLSRRSGRMSAFYWPSPVRVGYEAAHLAGTRIGNEGITGITSPKRYIWDTRLSLQSWRYNSRSMGISGRIIDPPVTGAFMAMISPDGRVLTEEERFIGENITTQPNFSRSSLFTFMLVEILFQARLQMNSPQNREQRQNKTLMRHFRSVTLTLPPGMPVAEQKILRNRAISAIDLYCEMLGISTNERPKIHTHLDEATATQIVWLYNEITERLGGNVDEFMQLNGHVDKDRETDNRIPKIRIASLDIGGGTTDLMISSYSVPVGETICPHQEFRESFKIAGDDILEHIITHIILPIMENSLRKAGVIDTQAFFSSAIGQDWGGQSEQERHLRQLFVNNVLEPVALAILSRYENVTDRTIDILDAFHIGDVLGEDKENIERSQNYIQTLAKKAGAENFKITDLEIIAKVQQVEASITYVMGDVIAKLCEAIWTYDCDVLLISGRPSRLRRIVDMIMAAMPVPVHRIIGMYHYRVGAYYPFRDAQNRISDPKTTVVVGASLCLQAEGKLQNFVLRSRDLHMYSTVRFIGRLEKNGQLRNKNVWLSNIDLPERKPQEDVGFKIDDFENTTKIGFRQLGIERWPASPLYVLEINNFNALNKIALPLTVTIKRQDIDQERENLKNDYSDREQFRIVEITDRNGEQYPTRLLVLRLQTMMNSEGYWRDTGRFTLA